MYEKVIPHKNFKGQARNYNVQFNLEVREVMKLLVEFQAIFKWRDSLKQGESRELSTAETVDFYDNLEKILLSAWGELDDSGDHFRKAGKYDFEESATFSACMNMFLSDPEEANKLIDGLMPKDLQEIVEKADVNFAKLEGNPETPEDLQKQIAQLRADRDRLASEQTVAGTVVSSTTE